MNEAKSVTENWYAVFTKSTLKHWLSRWLSPDFAHVKMVKEEEGLWLIVNSMNSFTHYSVELVQDYPHIRMLCPNAVILPVTTVINPLNYQWHLGIHSCVDVAKGILGVRGFFIWTPYQLYKYLISRECENG